MRTLHLLSNAHLDPVWQWQWEEGAAAALSTFRAAADFCDEYDGYVFNHNEAILYMWVEEYEPALFRRIQALVKAGKWNIMGGWFLQPDCNMPSGESFVRQILVGRTYFREKFGVVSSTAINFDSFGHTRGLVQIMQQAGYDSYIFMRPDSFPELPGQDFVWEGFNGSRIMAHKVEGGYNTLLGEAHLKIGSWLKINSNKDLGLILWGVGNHGGGPSRVDLNAIAGLMREHTDTVILHSTPEQYFGQLKMKELPAYAGDLNPRFVGCYTSMIRIKQKHRRLENELFLTEKMLSAAAVQGLLPYPYEELQAALKDLMTAQFHDILPGTSVQGAEEDSLRLLDHGLEQAARLKARAFFALASGQLKAAPKEYPILVYNPHPYPVKQTVECEFMLEDQNWKEQFSMPMVYRDGEKLYSQPEKEMSNLNLDWRKRVVFEAELAPSSMNRFDCRIEIVEQKPAPVLKEQDGRYIWETEELRVVINARSGLLDEYAAHGYSYLKPEAFKPLVMADNEDPWRMDADAFREVAGVFTLMSPGQGTDFSGVKGTLLPSVRVVEEGEVRTVLEAVLAYGQSCIQLVYKLPKRGTEVEVQVRVYWIEKDRMLKLAIPTLLEDARYMGQTAFGISSLADNGNEAVSHMWVAAAASGHGEEEGRAVTLINDGIYGSDYHDGEIRLSLLRSAGYCAHPILDRPIMPQDRFQPRMEQGERCYSFWLNGGFRAARLEAIGREAAAKNERPFALSFFPSGEGFLPGGMLELSDDVVQLSAWKREERGDGFVIRLFEPTGISRSTTIRLPLLGLAHETTLQGFEIKTFRLSVPDRTLTEIPLCEG